MMSSRAKVKYAPGLMCKTCLQLDKKDIEPPTGATLTQSGI
jgi:hypothetical protein